MNSPNKNIRALTPTQESLIDGGDAYAPGHSPKLYIGSRRKSHSPQLGGAVKVERQNVGNTNMLVDLRSNSESVAAD
jgi:hypothetical protein